MVVESENDEAPYSVFGGADLYDFAVPFDTELLLNEMKELSDEEIARMAYEIEYAFDRSKHTQLETWEKVCEGL